MDADLQAKAAGYFDLIEAARAAGKGWWADYEYRRIHAEIEKDRRRDAERETLLDALKEIIREDDRFRSSMAPTVEKDPLSLACDKARAVVAKSEGVTNASE